MHGRSVLHVIPAIAPRYGGPSTAIAGMCRGLQDSGLRTLVATTDADGPGRLEVERGRVISHEGLPTIFFSRFFGEGYKWSRGLRAWLNAHVGTFDVVHVHAVFSHSSVAAGRACRARGVPYVVRPLGTLDPWSMRQRSMRKRLLMTLAVRDVLINAAAMHYTSAEEMRLAQSAVPGLPPGMVVPLGIDEQFFQEHPASSPGAPYVLSLSRLDPKKRLDLLIAAFHAAHAEGPLQHWRLIIAGQGPADYVERLRALADEGPARAQISFPGWVGGPEKLRMIRNADLFALPSHQENFGISLVEGLACGVPAVVSEGVNVGPDLAAAGAGWVAGDDATFARALRDAMRDDKARSAASARARAFAAQFRWSHVANRLAAEYDRIAIAHTNRASAADVPARASRPAIH